MAAPCRGADDTEAAFGVPTVRNGSLATAESPRQVATVLVTVAMLTFLTLSPSVLIMTTCFTRIVIVMGFLRRALATQQLPPNPVIMGMALFLTVFVMYPTWEIAWQSGLHPYIEGAIDQETGEPLSTEAAFERTLAPVRVFMFRCLNENGGREEVETFLAISGREVAVNEDLTREKIPTHVLVPAFVTSELKRAFWMGFMLYLPFLVVDMVISSVLMSMGMMMLPPVMISLPFKVILFVMVDGWNLLMKGLVLSFPAGVT
jgi:flagellar biosynthetic protein FliP